ncbi:MAG: phosphatase PAP2 family protein [Telluria sp.]
MRLEAVRPPIGLALLALTAVAIILIGAVTDIDLHLADWAYDKRLGDFPWRHAWLAEVLSHVIVKRALIALAITVIGMVAWDWWRPRPWPALRRVQLRIVALSAMTIPAIVSMLKQVSSSHCPWDIDRYGGSAPYVRLLEALPAATAPGHCMPAGHASSALWLIALAVFFLPARPRVALCVFALMLAFGFALGWLQQLRGAHFLSHTLWSVWIACAVQWALLRWHAPALREGANPLPR